MDRHKCKLCYRSFSNGRALGGHMRSHMINLPLPQKPEDPPPPPPPPHAHLSEDADSASFLSSPSSSEGEAEEKGLSYGLRENPKRSIRVVDPEFSFAVDAGSVVLQDRESETESSKNPTRRRSKRTRKPDHHHHHHHHHYNVFKRLQEKEKKLNPPESWTEAEPVSSISGSTTEEDVAFWLMMLSRDKWTKHQAGYGRREDEDEDEDDDDEDDDEEEEEEEEEEELEDSMEETDDSEALKFPKNRNRGNYKCETCNKVFRSYQALGGHRASHKKIKLSVTYDNPQLVTDRENAATTTTASMAERKIHECPVCFRVFSSGQALGGHKRSHVTGFSSANSIPAKIPPKKFADSLIDLNLPAPFEEDDLSQIELSAVSDADFVNAIRQ